MKELLFEVLETGLKYIFLIGIAFAGIMAGKTLRNKKDSKEA